MKKFSLVVILIMFTFGFIWGYYDSAISSEDNILYPFIERAYYVNVNQVRQDLSLIYPDDIAGDKEIARRVEWVHTYVEELNDTEQKNKDIFIDIYSIIEHETRWVNYRILDDGLGFGVGSMLFTTAEKFTDKPHYELQSDVEFQIKLVVKYYMRLLNHFGCRDYTIVGYNRGYNFDLSPQSYNYWHRVNEIREELKK